MKDAHGRKSAVGRGRLRIAPLVLAVLCTWLVCQPAMALSDRAWEILSAFTQMETPLDDRLVWGFEVYGSGECENAAMRLWVDQAAFWQVKDCLSEVHATLDREAERDPDPAASRSIIDSFIKSLESEMDTGQLRRTIDRGAPPPSPSLEEGLQDLFREYGEYDCENVAIELSRDDLTVFERSSKLQTVSTCLERVRAKAVRQESWGAPAGASTLLEAYRTEIADEKRKSDADKQFLGLSWGVGVGFSIAFDDIIEEAEIVDGVVRSVEDRTQQPRVIFEFHRYVLCNKKDGIPVQNPRRGCGPFAAIATSQDDLLSGVAAGFMWGFKSPDDVKGTGFSIGLGAILDADVKSLAEGFEVDKPPPGTETEIRYETKSRWSAVLFFTRTF